MLDNKEESKEAQFTRPHEIKDIKVHYSIPAHKGLERAEKYMAEFSKYLRRRLNEQRPIVTPNKEGMKVKDKQWLKREISKLFTMYMAENVVDHIVIDKSDIDKIDDLIDEMDEPEITTEQAWDVIEGEYGDEVLQNNIDYVESQGYTVLEKTVIPKFVADEIKEHKTKYRSLWEFAHRHEYDQGVLESKTNKWIYDNSENSEEMVEKQNLISKAWLIGYKIEKEPHPILKAFDKKAEEFKKYSDSYRRIQEIREAIENVIEEEVDE